MVELNFLEISARLKTISFPEVNLVVGIGTGGTIPACMIAHQIGKPFINIKVNYRDEQNKIRYPEPKLISEINELNSNIHRILIVDDVCVSGKTLEYVKLIFSTYEICTFVLKGRNADIVLFPEVSECVAWPWFK